MIIRELAMQRIDLLINDFHYPVYPIKGSVFGITAFHAPSIGPRRKA